MCRRETGEPGGRFDAAPAAGDAAATADAADATAPGVFVPPIADGLRLHPESGHRFGGLGGQNQRSELDLSTSPATPAPPAPAPRPGTRTA